MAVLQGPDPSTLMPNLPGAGIVPEPAPQYQFAQPAPAQQAAEQPMPGQPHYNIFSRLMGAKHAADVQDKRDMVKYLMDSIHAGYQNPDSVPDQQMLDWGAQLTKLVGHPEVGKAVKADIDRYIIAKKAGKALGTVNAAQNQGGTIGQGGTGAPQAPGLESLKGPESSPWYAAQAAAPGPAAPPPMPNTSLFAPQVAGGQPHGGSPFQPQIAQQQPQQPQQPPGMPKPPGQPVPFGNAGQAGAPAPAEIPAPMKLASDTGKAGYGVPPQPPQQPVNLATRYGFRPPEEVGKRIAARARPTFTAKAEVEREQMPLDFAARKTMLEGEKAYQDASPKQRIQMLLGQPITPEYSGNLTGTYEADGVTHRGPDGELVPAGTLGKIRIEQGKEVFRPEVGMTRDKSEPDPESPTGWSYFVRDRVGKVLSKRQAPVPVPYAPVTTSSKGDTEQALNVGDDVAIVPIHRSSQSTVRRDPTGAAGRGTPAQAGPGVLPAPPGAAPAPVAAAPAAPTTPRRPAAAPAAAPVAAAPPAQPGQRKLPPGARVIGQTPAARLRDIENQYTENGRRVMEKLEPRMKMMERIIEKLEPFKDDDTPASDFFKTLKYRIGFAGEDGDFLSQVNLGSIGQAAQVLQGISKAEKVFNEAKIHTPNTWTNSHKLMYQKLKEIHQNMKDTEAAVNKWERKYPGKDAPPMTPPPAGAETQEQLFERLSKKHR